MNEKRATIFLHGASLRVVVVVFHNKVQEWNRHGEGEGSLS